MNWKRLREKVIEQNYPTEEQFRNIQTLYKKIADYIGTEHGMKVHFAGSASRKTCMKGDNDLDIFILFPEDTSRKELEEEGINIGKDVFKHFGGEYHVEYAEHPYTKGHIDGSEVEVVPCYDVPAEEIKSSVDRTPHHSRWSKNNLTEEQRKDVVVLKKFLSSKDLYGSSLKVRGFSGYLCEILVHEYGGFRDLIEEASDWPERKLIDPENHHDNLSKKLENKFEEDNLVVIDPVDPERNVAAVLNAENYSKFIYEAVNFLDESGMQHFTEEENEFTRLQIKNELDRRRHFTVIQFDSLDRVDDIAYPQLRKALRRLEQLLEKHGFTIYSSGFYVKDQTRIYIETEEELPELERVKGPKLFHGKEHIRQFRQKYDNTFVREDRLYAKTDREFTRPKEVVQNLPEETADLKEQGFPESVAEQLVEYKFVDPMMDDQKWLNFLGEELHVNNQ